MLRRILPLALAALVATFAVGACGGGGEDEDAAEGDTAAVETQPAETGATQPADTETTHAEGDPAAGKEVFASAGCGNCHTLEDAGAAGTTAPNLDARVPEIDEQRIIDQVTNGGENMPPFGDQLDEQQIRDVAAYLIHATS